MNNTLKPNMRCPVCGKHTFKMENDMEICPVCGFVNDGSQSCDYHRADASDARSSDIYKDKYFSSNQEVDE